MQAKTLYSSEQDRTDDTDRHPKQCRQAGALAVSGMVFYGLLVTAPVLLNHMRIKLD